MRLLLSYAATSLPIEKQNVISKAKMN